MDNTTLMLIGSSTLAFITIVSYIVMRQKTADRDISEDIASIKHDKH